MYHFLQFQFFQLSPSTPANMDGSFQHFNSHFVLKHLFQITEKKTLTENQQLFDGIIDVTLFDGVEGLN